MQKRTYFRFTFLHASGTTESNQTAEEMWVEGFVPGVNQALGQCWDMNWQPFHRRLISSSNLIRMKCDRFIFFLTFSWPLGSLVFIFINSNVDVMQPSLSALNEHGINEQTQSRRFFLPPLAPADSYPRKLFRPHEVWTWASFYTFSSPGPDRSMTHTMCMWVTASFVLRFSPGHAMLCRITTTGNGWMDGFNCVPS